MNFKGIAVERKLIRFLDLYERILVLEPYRDFVVNVFSLFCIFTSAPQTECILKCEHGPKMWTYLKRIL